MFKIFSKKIEPQPLFFATDIHCHILPGIDDGSPDVATSEELLQRMTSWGIKRIFASPHVAFDTFENTPSSMDGALAQLNDRVAGKYPGVYIGRSAEYRLDDLFADNFSKGLLMPLPGNLLLVENSFVQEPWNLDQLLFDIKVKGYKPILAHPERYHYYYMNKARYDKIHAAGTFFQINVLSLAGYYGKDEKRMAEYLIDKGMVDYIGTDLHNHRHGDAIESYLASKDYLRHRKALESVVRNDSI